MGYQNFTAGLAPNEADWDTNIGEQVIMRFVDAAERDAVLDPPPSFGIRCVTLDDGIEWVFLDDGVDGVWVQYGRWGEWDYSHVPTLSATSTPPTLGTGSVSVCRWRRDGTQVTAVFFVRFGSSGAAAGSGTYELDLPIPVSSDWYGADEFIAGGGVAIDAATGERKLVAVSVVGATTIRLEADGLTGPVTESNLISWGANDVVLSATITYETEEV